MFGTEGIKYLNKHVNMQKEKNMIVIADIKRGDIGSTASGYSNAYLGSNTITRKRRKKYLM